MRILFLDIDTTRPDHLGCYGYHRPTSPNIDRLAARGVRFDNYYVTDAPCLPSRAALFSGRFGIQTGVVNHGGECAEMKGEGSARDFGWSHERWSWTQMMRARGLYTVSFSPFADRHSAWWFYQGFSEMHDTGKRGNERADEITPLALDWIQRNARKDNWFLHYNIWDPHTPYRTPESYGNPFADMPPPSWLTEELRAAHFASYGPHSAQDTAGYGPVPPKWPRVPAQIASMEDYRRWIDGYDVGIRYADHHAGLVLDALAKEGVLDDTIIMVSSDHGENQGELNIYGDHQTADHVTSRVPLILCGPGIAQGRVDRELRYNLDTPPTFADLVGAERPSKWEGRSYLPVLRGEACPGRPYLVVSQCAWSCQRAVRFDRYILVRTYHDGLKDFPPVMLFDIVADPHETRDLARSRPELVARGLAMLDEWHADVISRSDCDSDPLWKVIREGGPYHARVGKHLPDYCRRLTETGREHLADEIRRRHGLVR